MTLTLMRRVAVFVVSLLLVSSAASAQVVIEMSSSTEGAADEMYVKDGMIRVNSQMQGNNMSSIFRDDEMLMLNHEEQSYYRFGREEVEAMSAQMNDARRQMEEQLANVPPEQRAMVERMLGDRMAAMMGSAPEPLRVERGGSSQAGQYSCVEHIVYRGDEKTFEICAAPVDSLGPAAAEARAGFEAMAEFMAELTEAFSQGPLGNMMENPYESMAAIEGFPVRTRRFDGDEVTSEVTLTSIRQEAIDDALFSPPDGYEREELPTMPQ